MAFTRLNRLARRLVSDLEDLYVHPTEDRPNYRDYYGPSFEEVQREIKVIQLERTKQKLEKWFRQREIPIRIIYTTVEKMNGGLRKPSVTPIGKKGVITYVYVPVGQEPPTAWIIAHNLGHALFDMRFYYKGESPYEDLSDVEEDYDPIIWEEKHNLMGRDPDRPALYPTTRAQQLGKIEGGGEAFHELFAQWIVKGQVILNPRNLRLEKELDSKFRYYVDKAASLGAVVYND